MKKTILSFVLVLYVLMAYSQVPEGFNYQVVVRNSSGEIISNSNISVRISILQDYETGTVIYSEVHNPSTNQFGLVNLIVGDGEVLSGVFSTINWGLHKCFLKVEIDPTGGNSFIHLGSMQLMSVPYSLHSKSVDNDNVEDADADATNELQSLSISGSELSISDGNSVVLPELGASVWEKNNDNIFYNSGNIGIYEETPQYPLDVRGDESVETTIYGKNDKIDGVAVYGDAYGTESIAVMGEGKKYGGLFRAYGNDSYGVFGAALLSADVNYGGYFVSLSPQGRAVYADGGQYDFYAANPEASNFFAGTVGIGTSSPSEALSFGNAYSGLSFDNAGGCGIYWKESGETTASLFHGGNYFWLNSDYTLSLNAHESLSLSASNGKGRIILGEREISFYSNSDYPTMTIKDNGNVGIGIDWDTPNSLLSVGGEGVSDAGVYGEAIKYGVYGKSVNSDGMGVRGFASSSSGANYGGNFLSNSTDGTGVYGESKKYGVSGRATSSTGIGIYGVASSTSGQNYGGYFQTNSTSGRGLRGYASASSGSTYGGAFNAANSSDGTGVWASGGKWDFYAASASSSKNYGSASSIRWKKNIKTIDAPLKKIVAIRGVYYDWDEEHGGEHDVGCIAEEVGKVIPEIVVFEKNGIDAEGLDYSRLTPLLIEACKALKAELDEVKKANNMLKSRLEDLENMMESYVQKTN